MNRDKFVFINIKKLFRNHPLQLQFRFQTLQSPTRVAESESIKPHVAILPSPGMGHVIPLFELAKRLVIDHGFQVSFLVIPTEASAAQNQLLRSTTTTPSGLQLIHLPLVDVSTIVTDNMPVLNRLCVIVHESLRPLRSVLVGLDRRPSALIIDLFCTEAFDVCDELSIPVYSFFTASTALLAFSLYLPTLDREVEGEFVDLPEPVRVPGCRPLSAEDLLDQVKNRKIDEYKWYLFHLSRLPKAAGILANTWDDLEPVALRALRDNPFFKDIPTPTVHSIGPVIKRDEPLSKSDEEILAWLHDQPPDSVLFVALGSGGTLSSEQLVELAWGLELSQQRFILVARKPTDASASAEFFSVGSDANDPASYLPKGFVKRNEKMGLVVPSWAPQLAVLRHGSTGGFLSHCGWNSTLESVAHGVPMIAWPLYAEQRMNATMLAEEIGVAVRPAVEPEKGMIRREEIERVVRLVMEGEGGKVMRRRARQLRDSAVKTLSSSGLSCESLCRVAEIWKSGP